MHSQRARRDYASTVKKPKIDESLREKLLNEIQNPTSFMGRQSAHADLTYTLHNLEVAAPKSSHLSNQTTPFPEVNVSSFGKGRNSIQAQLNPNNSLSLKKDREYIRRIIQESKEQRSSSVNGDIHDGKPDNRLKWDQQENRFTRKPPEMRDGPSKDQHPYSMDNCHQYTYKSID